MSTPDQILCDLIAANNLIADPARWCKGSFALDAAGNSVGRYSTAAVLFCGIGAVCRVVGKAEPVRVEYLHEAARNRAGYTRAGTTFDSWQDAPERTHAEVTAAFARAIDMRRTELGIPLNADKSDVPDWIKRGLAWAAEIAREIVEDEEPER